MSDFDLGPSGVIGLEYKIPKSSYRLFTDFTLFMEIVDQPVHIWFLGGIGIRYLFTKAPAEPAKVSK